MNTTPSTAAANESYNSDPLGDPNDDLSKDASVIKRSLASLNAEQHQFHGVTTLNWLHLLILFGSLAVTIVAWYWSSSAQNSKVETSFNQQHNQVVELLTERLQKYEDALWSGVAVSRSLDREITRSEWKRYAAALDINSRYPGISGIGLIVPKNVDELDNYVRAVRQDVPNFDVHPQHDGDESLIITQIEPIEANTAALGLDVAFEKNRRAGANLSRSSGNAIITEPIILVQDMQKTPGFLFYAPVYNSLDVGSSIQRQNTFSHWVYAPFIMSELIAGVLDQSSREIEIRITDNGNELYSEKNPDRDSPITELAEKQLYLDIYGRQWLVEAWPTNKFHLQTTSKEPLFILFGGLAIDAVLLLLFLLMARSNRRIMSLADDLATASDHLKTKSEELQQSNVELQSFAYVASHDLKSPLAGIRYLTEFIEEDLLHSNNQQPINTEVCENLNRIRTQVTRMSQLIDGVLSYSAIGNRTPNIEVVDIADLLIEIKEDLQLSAEQVAHETLLPVLHTCHLSLKQVLGNLISNAIKYHPYPETAVVSIIVEDFPSHHRFSVSDTGPGIDPQFHERIFEVFETLESSEEIDSTGVGLAIVKKTVQSQGGEIEVSSALGQGSTFTFTWPKSTLDYTAVAQMKLAS